MVLISQSLKSILRVFLHLAMVGFSFQYSHNKLGNAYGYKLVNYGCWTKIIPGHVLTRLCH